MSEPFADEISGGPERPRHRAVAWATLAVLGAVAVGGGAYAATRGDGGGPSAGAAAQLAAATTSPSPSSSASPHDKSGRRGPGGPMVGGPMMRGPAGVGGMFGVGGQVLHGESTVQTRDGKTQILDTQRGTISSLDSAKKSLTVTSTDKVSFSYLTDSNTRFIVFSASSSAKPGQATFADLKQGDTVEIVAIRSGDTRTATSVVDGAPTVKAGSKAGPNGDANGGKGWPGPGHRPGAPSPSASASGASA